MVIVLVPLKVTFVLLDLNTSILETWINDASNLNCIFQYGSRYLPANAGSSTKITTKDLFAGDRLM